MCDSLFSGETACNGLLSVYFFLVVLQQPFFHFMKQLDFAETARWIRESLYSPLVIESAGFKKTGELRVFMMGNHPLVLFGLFNFKLFHFGLF